MPCDVMRHAMLCHAMPCQPCHAIRVGMGALHRHLQAFPFLHETPRVRVGQERPHRHQPARGAGVGVRAGE